MTQFDVTPNSLWVRNVLKNVRRVFSRKGDGDGNIDKPQSIFNQNNNWLVEDDVAVNNVSNATNHSEKINDKTKIKSVSNQSLNDFEVESCDGSATVKGVSRTRSIKDKCLKGWRSMTSLAGKKRGKLNGTFQEEDFADEDDMLEAADNASINDEVIVGTEIITIAKTKVQVGNFDLDYCSLGSNDIIIHSKSENGTDKSNGHNTSTHEDLLRDSEEEDDNDVSSSDESYDDGDLVTDSEDSNVENEEDVISDDGDLVTDSEDSDVGNEEDVISDDGDLLTDSEDSDVENEEDVISDDGDLVTDSEDSYVENEDDILSDEEEESSIETDDSVPDEEGLNINSSSSDELKCGDSTDDLSVIDEEKDSVSSIDAHSSIIAKQEENLKMTVYCGYDSKAAEEEVKVNTDGNKSELEDLSSKKKVNSLFSMWQNKVEKLPENDCKSKKWHKPPKKIEFRNDVTATGKEEDVETPPKSNNEGKLLNDDVRDKPVKRFGLFAKIEQFQEEMDKEEEDLCIEEEKAKKMELQNFKVRRWSEVVTHRKVRSRANRTAIVEVEHEEVETNGVDGDEDENITAQEEVKGKSVLAMAAFLQTRKEEEPVHNPIMEEIAALNNKSNSKKPSYEQDIEVEDDFIANLLKSSFSSETTKTSPQSGEEEEDTAKTREVTGSTVNNKNLITDPFFKKTVDSNIIPEEIKHRLINEFWTLFNDSKISKSIKQPILDKLISDYDLH